MIMIIIIYIYILRSYGGARVYTLHTHNTCTCTVGEIVKNVDSVSVPRRLAAATTDGGYEIYTDQCMDAHDNLKIKINNKPKQKCNNPRMVYHYTYVYVGVYTIIIRAAVSIGIIDNRYHYADDDVDFPFTPAAPIRGGAIEPRDVKKTKPN